MYMFAEGVGGRGITIEYKYAGAATRSGGGTYHMKRARMRVCARARARVCVA